LGKTLGKPVDFLRYAGHFDAEDRFFCSRPAAPPRRDDRRDGERDERRDEGRD
jgi:hypothetical protein